MKFLCLLSLFMFFHCGKSFAAVDTARVHAHSYASTNVTTSAYVTLIASTTVSAKAVQVCDTSGKVLKIATGAAGSEVDRFTVQVSGCTVVSYYLAPGTRLAIEAIDASATSGYNTVSLIP